MHYDVVISGAGMAGMSLAIALQAYGYSVVIIEKYPAKMDERTTAVNHATKLFFEQYKIWSLLEDYAQPILDIFTMEGKSSTYLHYDYKVNHDNHPMGYVIKNRHIKEALASFKIKKLFPITYKHISNNNNGVEITLENQEKITAKLLVIAEGRNSKIYDLFNIKRISKDYHQNSIICNIEHLEDHQGMAQERFYPSGPFALLPMQGKYFSSLIWTANTDLAKELVQLPPMEFTQAINQHCNFHITKIVSDIQSYPLSLSLSRRYYKNRLLLIGDTMQNIHPVAGQGFNLIVANIQGLVDNIKKYNINEKALQSFALSRLKDNLMMAGATHGLVRLFSNDNKILKKMRNIGLGCVQELSFIKRQLVNHATGRTFK